MPRPFRFVFGAAFALSLSSAALAEDPTAKTVVAVVGGVEITLGHMLAAREALPEQYKTLPPESLYKGILDQLVQQTLLVQSMEGKLGTRDLLDIENTERGAIAAIALQQVSNAAVTDDAIKAAYDAKFAATDFGTEYNAAHILVDSEEKAKDLAAQLEAGGDFAALAKANSTDQGSGANGGDLGWFGVGMMVKPFEDAVLAATPGKIAGPIQTEFGWHLILVKETRAAAAPALEDVAPEIAAELERAAVDAHLNALAANVKIDRPGEAFDPTLITKIDLIK